MSHNTIAASSETAEAPPAPNDAWYLHSQGRRFGPLTEDEIRGYFRASMVSASDFIAIAAQFGCIPAAEVAEMLGMPPPSAAMVAPPVATSIVFTQDRERSIAGLAAVGAFVALIGIAYFSLHVKATLAPPLPRATIDRAAERSGVPPSEASDNPGAVELASDSRAALPPVAEELPASDSRSGSQVASSFVAPVPDAPRVAVDTWQAEAVRLWRVQDWAALLVHAGNWAAAQPNRYDPWFYLGIANEGAGNWLPAIDAFKRALAISPSDFESRWELGYARQQVHQFRESADLFSVLVTERPDEPRLWANLGYDMTELGEYDQAVEALQKSVQIDPKYRRGWWNLASCYAHFGYMDKSREAWVRYYALRD